ncbi:heterokaryon incompatibility protein-domain-containing protein [Macrophomina phaseolina]|uniref:Heterokaryon incompatibility protein-domain-containing protein n=1 Tax=Macrophomina phaseolina TaxID=35725 RepID=A0ABQ8FR64_9PEZI|nr:heterokaryon incompatibility protein-domain-containing protein [Macrophomina phaseolina]
MASTNIYTPLNPGLGQIRILRLLPGLDKEEIKCELFISTTATPFEALSYVWGDENGKIEITIQGERKPVTKNLEAALRHIRLDDKHRDLWVDAVCIDQGNETERNAQVRMMDDIYSNAKRVVTWLGAGQGRGESLQLIKELGASPDRHWDSSRHAGTGPNNALGTLKLFFFLRDTKWYQRIWTLQEAVLAKSVIYVCGTHVFAQGEIEGLMRSFTNHFLRDMCCDIDAMTIPDMGVGNLSAQMTPYLKQMRSMVDVADKHDKLPFLDIAPKFRHRQATDPRDKVFGLLGLTSDLKKDIIKYESTAADVYAEVVIQLITRTGNLDVLSHVLPRTPRSAGPQVAGLPSWAPDWSDHQWYQYWRLNSLMRRQSYATFFNACAQKSTPRSRDPSESLQTLLLDGHQQGSISKVGEAFVPHNGGDSGHFKIDVLQQWREMTKVDLEPQRDYAIAESGNPSCTILDAFWRTLCANIDPFTSEPDKVKEADMRTRRCHDLWWWDSLRQSKYRDVAGAEMHLPADEYRTWETHVFSMTAGRRFFLSSEGLIGLAPENAQKGDQIWVVNGGRMPLILRPLSGAQNDRFNLVGDSYVHGIMQGEYCRGESQERTIFLV